ncbi:hypothetical protein [Embleya sp. NPDC005575]|uniref:hypothetical protein n=1 Tax=Embleya sp. NPDC005575 TaxID=3156892 RepID=UPI0033AF3F44
MSQQAIEAPTTTEPLTATSIAGVIEVAARVTAAGDRLVIEAVHEVADGAHQVLYTVVPGYAAPTAQTAEADPPQCSF